jgi:hypothetical protein
MTIQCQCTLVMVAARVCCSKKRPPACVCERDSRCESVCHSNLVIAFDGNSSGVLTAAGLLPGTGGGDGQNDNGK